MNFLLSTSSNGADALTLALIIVCGVVGFALIIASIWAFFTRIGIWIVYRKYNKMANSENLSAREAAVKFKDLCGLNEVEVKKCSFWRAMFSTGGSLGFGNNYSIYKKVIFLRKNILDVNSITAVGIATQKVGLALLDKQGDKQYQFQARVKPWLMLAPIAFFPIVLIGIVIDLILIANKIVPQFGVATIISTLLSFIVLAFSFVVILFTIKTEKRANALAMDLMEKNNFLTADERGYIKQIYNAYIKAFVADFVVAVLKIVYETLKLVIRIIFRSRNN